MAATGAVVSLAYETEAGMKSEHRCEHLVARLREKGIKNEEVLQAIGRTPRHRFVGGAVARRAYQDDALPIGYEQTISQPFVVALMTQALMESERPEKVLEIGTGSGYQCAVLSHLVKRVFSVERIPQLHRKAARLLHDLGYRNVMTRQGDGTEGWSSQAPFDAIMVTAAAATFPEKLAEQLRLGGCMMVPEGLAEHVQMLVRYIRQETGFERKELIAVRFVPLISG